VTIFTGVRHTVGLDGNTVSPAKADRAGGAEQTLKLGGNKENIFVAWKKGFGVCPAIYQLPAAKDESIGGIAGLLGCEFRPGPPRRMQLGQ
jgi:hypothetical protein